MHFYILWNVFLVPVMSKWTEINEATSREEHQRFIMWQRASEAVNIEKKKEVNLEIRIKNYMIKVLPNFLLQKIHI